MFKNREKGMNQSKSVVDDNKESQPSANDKTGAKSELKNETKSEPVGKDKAKPEPDNKSKSVWKNVSSVFGYMKGTSSSKAKSVNKDNEKKAMNLADVSDDEDEGGVMEKKYHNSGGSSFGRTDYESYSHTSRVGPRESTLPRDSVTSSGSKSYAQVARDKKPHFSDSPQNSVSSRASAGGFHPNQDISGLVEQTALRRISSAGRTTEIGNYKPAEPLTVERHNKIKLGSRVMERGFMEKGIVRWLGMFDGGECIAGLEMERSKSIYNDKYDDKKWFRGPVLREHYVDCVYLEIMEPETKTPESYERSMYRNPHPASVANNYSQVVELEDTSDGRIGVGMRAQIKHSHRLGTVRWIGLSSREEWVGLEMDEKSPGIGTLFGDTLFECEPGRAEYVMASRVEPLPYENFPSSPRPSVHRDDFIANRHTQSHSNSSVDSNSHVRATPPKALFMVVEKERHGDYKLDDIVKYTAHDSGSVPKPGQIRFIGRVKDDRNGTVYVGLDMYDFAYNRDDHTFEDFPQFEAENMKPGCALYCDIRDISPLEDVPMDTGAEDSRRQERKGSDSRLHRHTVNTDTIKEEPSSGDISPDLDDDVDLYGAGTSSKITSYTRRTPDKRETHQRGDDVTDMKAARKSDPLSNGGSYNTRSRNGGNNTYTSSMKWKDRDEEGPELKKPPLKDLSLVQRVSQYEGLEEDAMVQTTGKKVVYGVIRWMGYLPGRQDPTEPPLVGIETEEYSGDADRNNSPNMQRYGVYDGYPLFECKSGRGAFFNAKRLLRNQRFDESADDPDPELSYKEQIMKNSDSMQDLLHCSVCLERFTQPKVLSCQHTFCVNCLRGIAKDAKTLTCPQCRVVHPVPEEGMGSLQDCLITKKLLSVVDESPVCFDCGQESSLSECKHCEESVCADCRSDHTEIITEIKLLMRPKKCATADGREKDSALWNDLLHQINHEKKRANEKFDDLHQKIEEQKGSVLHFLETMEQRVQLAVTQDQVPLAQAMEQQLGARQTTSSLKEFKQMLDSTEGMMMTAIETGRSTDFKIVYNSYTLKPIGNVVFGDEVLELK